MENELACAPLLLKISREHGLSITDEKFAQLLDERDPMKWQRSKFYMPKVSEITDSSADSNGKCVAVHS